MNGEADKLARGDGGGDAPLPDPVFRRYLMPEAMERELKRKARRKFGSTTSERARKFIYGIMRKQGWTPSTQKKGK